MTRAPLTPNPSLSEIITSIRQTLVLVETFHTDENRPLDKADLIGLRKLSRAFWQCHIMADDAAKRLDERLWREGTKKNTKQGGPH